MEKQMKVAGMGNEEMIRKLEDGQTDNEEEFREKPILCIRRRGRATLLFVETFHAIKLLLLCTAVWLLYQWYFKDPRFLLLPVDVEEFAVTKGVPSYVVEYAPLVWLDKNELYMPSDMESQISNTLPEIEYQPIINSSNLNKYNLDTLNKFGNTGLDVYLTSIFDITSSPPYLFGVVPNKHGQTPNISSAAIIVNDKGYGGFVDAYYMYFYSYNQGNTVLGRELGDHVGDWEHNMIRFRDGIPQHIWYSQHATGQVFTYKVAEKIRKRPITYSAQGSHANYAIAGIHDHAIPNLNLPFGFVTDRTSKGYLWDPIQSAYWYMFNKTDATFESKDDSESPLAVMRYRGAWGDQTYPDDDPRQDTFFGFKKFGSGPTGPWDKQLDRLEMCPRSNLRCIVRDRLGP